MADITIDELLANARAGLDRVDPQHLDEAQEHGALVVDTRTGEQRDRDGELPGALVIDRTVLEWRLAPSSEYRSVDVEPDQQVVLVCNDGYSSSLAAATLQELGVNATDVIGGYQAWRAHLEGQNSP